MRFSFSIVALFLPGYLTAQVVNTDSLSKSLDEISDPKSRIAAYNTYSEHLQKSHPLVSTRMADSAIALSKKYGWEQGLALAYKNRGNNYYNDKIHFNESIDCFTRSLEISKKIRDTLSEARALGSLGNAHKDKSNWFEAHGYYSQSLKLFQSLGNKRGEGTCALNIGSIYFAIGLYEKAMAGFENCYRLAIESGNMRQAIESLNNIGASYKELNDLNKSLAYYEQALKLSANDPMLIDLRAMALINISTVHRDNKDFAKMDVNLNRADSIYKAINSRLGQVHVLTNRGSFYMGKRKYKKALASFKASLVLSDSIGDKRLITRNTLSVGHAYLRLKSYSEAVRYFENAMVLAKENLLSVELKNAQNFLEETIEARNERRSNRQFLLIAISIVLLFFLVLKAGKLKVDPFLVEIFGLAVILFFFELLHIYLHPAVGRISNHNPIWMLLLMVALALILGVVHKELIKFLKKRISYDSLNFE